MSKNIKTKRRYSARTVIVWFLIILFLSLAIFIIYLFLQQSANTKQSRQNIENSNQQTIQPDPTSTSENRSSRTEDQIDLENGKTSQTPQQYEEADVQSTNELNGFITYSGKNGDKLTIRVTINQLLKETGTCILSLASTSGKTVSRTVNTVDNPSSATCQGFDIPLSEVPVGEYQINIEVKTTRQKGNIKGNVTI